MFKEEGFSFLQQMGMAHAQITGSSLDGAAVTESIIIQLLRGAPVSLKTLITLAVTVLLVI